MEWFITPMLASEGMTGLAEAAWALQAMSVGIFVGAAVAVAIAFRDESAHVRLMSVVLLLLAAALLLVGSLTGVLLGAAPWWAVHPLFLLVLSPVLALVGRYFFATDGKRQDTSSRDR
jgi:hypothetical protein